MKPFKIILFVLTLPILLVSLLLWGLLSLLTAPPRFIANRIIAFFIDGRFIRKPEVIYLELINTLQIMAADFEEQKRVLTEGQLDGRFILEMFWDCHGALDYLVEHEQIDPEVRNKIERLNEYIESLDTQTLYTRQALEYRKEWRIVRELAFEILETLEEEITPDANYWRSVSGDE